MECPSCGAEMEAVDQATSATTGEVIGTTYECECGEVEIDFND